MIIYRPNQFLFTDIFNNELNVTDGSIRVEDINIRLPFKDIEPNHSKQSLILFIKALEQVFKPNIEIPMTAIGIEWFKILMTNKQLGTLPPNVITGVNESGIFVQVLSSTIPNELYIWSDALKTFSPITEEELNNVFNSTGVITRI